MRSACIIVIFIHVLLRATVPPEAYELQVRSKQHPVQEDTSLSQWLSEFSENANIFDLSAEEFVKSTERFDEVSRSYLSLRYANVNNIKNPDLVMSLEKDSIENKVAIDSHPLKPYLFEELLESGLLEDKNRELILKRLVQEGARSCPHKQILLKEMETDEFKKLTLGQYKSWIEKLNGFRSKSFRKQAVEMLLEVLGKDNIPSFVEELRPLVTSVSGLDVSEEILSHFEIQQVKASASPEFKKFSESLQSILKKNQCNQAKTSLLSSIMKIKELEVLSTTESFLTKVESCFRKKGNQSRISFWQSISSSLEKAYGYPGELLARKKIGAIYWLIDEFEKAKQIFESIRLQAIEQNDLKAEAHAIYTLGRVTENEGKDQQAIKYYREYVGKFPVGENADDAFSSLILLHFHLGSFEDSLQQAERVIQIQTSRPELARNDGVLSYAYFWAGRAALRVGKKDVALAMWKRAASEYYSTFYGAMGHFLYEKVTGEEYFLEPSRSGIFRPDAFLSRFSPDDRNVLERATILLKAGMKEEANCEIMELMADADDDNDRLLMKSLLLYATSDWLEAVKAYSALSRTYRGALPSGFEKLLFPKAFAQDIETNSAKLQVEPALIYGIIRQESVFNPRARSSAGARGLMQLMPATAKYEAQRLSSNYLPYKKRLELQRDMRDANNLYRPSDNVIVGVHHVYRLLKKYNHPVFVLTSYNANPRATERWIKNIPTEDILTFMERIPYQETRLYVKLVMRNYFFYKKWYEPSETGFRYLDTLVASDMEFLKKNP